MEIKLTDSHCHLDFQEFDQQRAQLISECATAGIHRIIIPATQPNNWSTILELAATYSPDILSNTTTTHLTNILDNISGNTPSNSVSKNCQLFPTLGIHPWFLNTLNQTHLDDLAIQVEKHRPQLVAIGETGIDGSIAKQSNNLTQQQHFFASQLSLAKQYKLPVIVHHRQSHQTIIPMLKQANLSEGGVIHAFSGSYQQAKAYLDLGFYLGVGGTITYPRAVKTINTIKKLPLTRLLLETDAPSMPLFGYQGQINTPLHCINVFEKLVELRTEKAGIIAEQLEQNVAHLFKLF